MKLECLPPMKRRSFIKLVTAASVSVAAGRGFSMARKYNDDALLDDLFHRCFNYFADAMDPVTGI